MTIPTVRATVCAFVFACTCTSARAVTVTATLLEPVDLVSSVAVGASNSAQVGSGFDEPFSTESHALRWSGTAISVIDLHPADFTESQAAAATDLHQVGTGRGPATDNKYHALLWSGTAGSVVDLHPDGFDKSSAADVSGARQVGVGTSNDDLADHALLWLGGAASHFDLHPDGFDNSYAQGVYEIDPTHSVQAGYGYGPSTGSNSHALLWSDTAESVVDLNPTDFTESIANDIYGTKQVGSGSGLATLFETHALLWSGTAASKVDLHPFSGFISSQAFGISSAGQVGSGYGPATAANDHALYWNGTAASFVDLHPSTISTGYDFVSTVALGIAEDGTIVGYGVDDGNFQHAIMWKPLADPDSGVAADYNNNGVVDAGDYITWRKGSNPLRNEVLTMGSNTPLDYTAWRNRFGNTSGSGSATAISAIASVPEPTSFAPTILAGALGLFLSRRRTRCQSM